MRVDHIGRPVIATNAAGAKVWSLAYLPFGGVRASTGVPATLRFPGQWFQSETGLHQNWMRDYDPTLGRYLQADPLGLVDGASVYGYARQNPGRWIDPRGEVGADTIVGGVFGGIKLGGAIIGGGIAGAIGIILTPSPLGDGTLQPGATIATESDSGDCCQGHYASIEKQLQIVKRRFNEYWENPLNLPETGPYPPGSRSGHRNAIKDAQRGLRNRLEAARSAGCVAVPADAWHWATRPIW